MCPCRGRRRGRRWISEIPQVRCFLPEGQTQEIEAISLSLEELEAIRLVDLLELEQEEAAFYMGISRKAFWNDLVSARKKIAAALVYGSGIRIEGGSYILRDSTKSASSPDNSETELLQREMLLLKARLERLSAKIAGLKRAEGEAHYPDHLV